MRFGVAVNDVFGSSVQLPLYESGNRILLTPFVGQTAFVAVLAAMIVNISWRRKKNRRLRLPKSNGNQAV
jgi:hypothetical protein